MKREAGLPQALRMINNGPVVLVATRTGRSDNICTVAWSSPVCKAPALLALQINTGSYTWSQLEENPCFTLNIPGRKMLPVAAWCGSVSGREVPKPGSSGILIARGRSVDAPLLLDCLGHLECRAVEMDRKANRITAEVLYAQADEEAFFEGWTMRPGFEPLHHLGGEWYQCGGDRLRQPPIRSYP